MQNLNGQLSELTYAGNEERHVTPLEVLLQDYHHQQVATQTAQDAEPLQTSLP